MADISKELAAIMAAVFGRDVRQSIHDAIDKVNKTSEVCISAGTDVTGPTSSSTGFYERSLYININTWQMWKCTGVDTWQLLGSFKGDDGKGIDEITGPTTVGLVDTYTIVYTDGTTDTFEVHNGADGIDGIDGANGSKWYKGTALTGTGTGITGFPGNKDDFYLNSTDGYVYQCVQSGGASNPGAALWDYVMTLTGDGGSSVTVVDNLNSTSQTDALSANQGRNLNEKKIEKPASASAGQFLGFDGSNWGAVNAPSGGGMLPYLYIDSEAGATVTVNQPDGTTITPTPAGSSHWECELTGGYGTYVIHSVLSGQGDATLSLAVDTVKEYHVTDTHYNYTINVTAPSGSTVRIVGGGETYTGTGTGSSRAFAVHTASTAYTVAVTMDGNTKSETITSAATSGQSGSVTIAFGTINLTYANDFRGKTITCTKSGVTVTKTAPSSGNTMTLRVPTTGTWTISGVVSGRTYSVNANVTSLSTAVSANLQTTINVNVTLHGAVGAVITYTDANGSKTQTLDSTGKKTKVAISVMPSSPTIVFTDTTVAKDPDNLSNNYTKSVTITNGMTDVYVMPDNALYWYGWMTDVEHTQSGKQQGSGTTSCTLEMQTNGIRYNGVGTSNGAYILNLGFNQLLHASDKIKCIISDCSSNASFYGNVGASSTYNSFLNEKQAFNSAAANASGLYTKELTKDGYPGVESLTYYNSSFTLRALWYE